MTKRGPPFIGMKVITVEIFKCQSNAGLLRYDSGLIFPLWPLQASCTQTADTKKELCNINQSAPQRMSKGW